jgi:hypothetical protein
VINTSDFCHLFSPPAQWKIDISFSKTPESHTRKLGGRERET